VTLSRKDLRELKYWTRAELLDGPDGLLAQKALQRAYLVAFGSHAPERPWVAPEDQSILEIGTGPYWGMLPHLNAGLRVAIDPLIEHYEELSLLEGRGDIRYFAEPFEQWDPGDYVFDTILCANALDHGEMGFHLLPKIARILKPGGVFYLHVHLRPLELLNLIHDHSLTTGQLDRHLSYTELREVHRELFSTDPVMQCEIPAMIGIWQKPL